MQTKNASLQLLLTAAVISLTVLCAAGIATLTGLVPSSFGAMRLSRPVLDATATAPVTKQSQKAPARKAVPQPSKPLQRA
jgi:hypothetical protein